jgi:hypothetical protein
MQRESRSRTSVLWWLAPILVLLLLDAPILYVVIWLFGRFIVPIAILVGAFACISHLAKVALTSQSSALQDRLSEEEGGHRRRLAALRNRAEQMEQTLRDLRGLQLPPEQLTRAKWAEVDLEEALRRAHAEMAHGRGSLFSLETVRWFARLEPLLRDLHRLDEAAVARWLGRLETIRTQGGGILARLRSDAEAAASKPGASAEKLLDEALQEIGALRADLVTRRAELLARAQPVLPGGGGETSSRMLLLRAGPDGEPFRSDPAATLSRLLARIYQIRARREVHSWEFDDDPERS